LTVETKEKRRRRRGNKIGVAGINEI